MKAVFINCGTFLIISLSSNNATWPKCNVIDLYKWNVTKNYSDLLYITYNLLFLVCSKVSTRCNSSSRGKNACDITISFCRIAIIVYHVGDNNSVLFPQLSASYQTRTTQRLSRLLLAFNDIKIFSSAPHPEIFRFPMNNGCKWLMFFNGFCMLHCYTIIQHKQNFGVSHFETRYCIS